MADTAPRRCRVCGHFEPDLREHYDAHAATAQQALTRCADSDAAQAHRARLRISNCKRLKASVRKAPRFFQRPLVPRTTLAFGARFR
ncbi:MAG: hypothetical protein ABJC61_15775 [Acidobacteriota bacterium]